MNTPGATSVVLSALAIVLLLNRQSFDIFKYRMSKVFFFNFKYILSSIILFYNTSQKGNYWPTLVVKNFLASVSIQMQILAKERNTFKYSAQTIASKSLFCVFVLLSSLKVIMKWTHAHFIICLREIWFIGQSFHCWTFSVRSTRVSNVAISTVALMGF